jgi:hypothetical protein
MSCTFLFAPRVGEAGALSARICRFPTQLGPRTDAFVGTVVGLVDTLGGRSSAASAAMGCVTTDLLTDSPEAWSRPRGRRTGSRSGQDGDLERLQSDHQTALVARLEGKGGGDVPAGRSAADGDRVRVSADVSNVVGHPEQGGQGVLDGGGERVLGRLPVVAGDDDALVPYCADP